MNAAQHLRRSINLVRLKEVHLRAQVDELRALSEFSDGVGFSSKASEQWDLSEGVLSLAEAVGLVLEAAEVRLLALQREELVTPPDPEPTLAELHAAAKAVLPPDAEGSR